jgi:hypothetical protein
MQGGGVQDVTQRPVSWGVAEVHFFLGPWLVGRELFQLSNKRSV